MIETDIKTNTSDVCDVDSSDGLEVARYARKSETTSLLLASSFYELLDEEEVDECCDDDTDDCPTE
jgi:hypothetical protein